VERGVTVPVGTVLATIGPAGGTASLTREPGDDSTSPAPDAPPKPVARSEKRSGRGQPSAVTPLIRRLLAEAGLTADDVTGSGPNGRITRGDVAKAAAARSGDDRPAEPTPAASQPENPAAVGTTVTEQPSEARDAFSDGGSYTVPFTTVRRLTAARMPESKATSAHTLMATEVDYSAVDAVRTEHGRAWRSAEGFSLSYLPFVLRAVIDGLRSFPYLNASVGRDELVVHRSVALGVAVDVGERGLVVPVIPNADDLRLRVLGRRVAELAVSARSGALTADAYAGGTFTVTNTGTFGTLLTGAIINQPQVAILAVDGVAPKPVAVPTSRGEHAVAVHPVGNLALTFDHRAVDGAYAGRFLAALKASLEDREWETEL
jgi:2-oxoglutarate dehydrogenase E2 component (dihydrolipoamide succinyltransferase)